jgi:hypothetical protein
VLPRNLSLERLDISRNNLVGADMLPLRNALIAVHSNLKHLDVSRNPLGSLGVTALANALEDNQRLLSLRMCGVTATDDGETVAGVVAIAAALELNKTLTALDLASNNLTDFTGKMEGAARLAAALQRNVGLRDLDLSDNCFGEVGARMLDECIVSNTSLTRLELGMNRLGPAGATHIAALLRRRSLGAIQDLGLASNEITGRYGAATSGPVVALSTALEGHETLSCLDLQRNGISVDGGRALAEALRRNTALTQLRLGGANDAVKGDIISMRLIAARTKANAALGRILAGEQMVDEADRKKQTALHLAADAGSVLVAQMLLAPELNAQRDLRNFRSLTPLHCAVEARDAPMITVLLGGFDVDLSVPDHVGDTCLHKAVRAGDGALASLLLLKGADMEQRNNAGFRALDLTRSQLLRELLVKTTSRRPFWMISGREDDELRFGSRIRRHLMSKKYGFLECWCSGGGVSAAAMDIRGADDPLYDPVSDEIARKETPGDVISREAFRDVPAPLKKMSRTRMNRLFAGYEGDPGDLGPEMLKRCSACIFLAGHYSMRSPLCLQQLSAAVDARVPIVVIKVAQTVMPPVIEEALGMNGQGKRNGSTRFVDFTSAFMPNTLERGLVNFETRMDELAPMLRRIESEYIERLPAEMTSMIGEDADAFALQQVDGKFFVLLAHGGKHREFATNLKMELEQHRLWCFASHGDEHMDTAQRARFDAALASCMVFCPVLTERSLASSTLQQQIRSADACGKPIFPIMLSSVTVPKNLRAPVSLLRRHAFVFHVHNGDESGAINFRCNFDHLAKVVRARVAEGAVMMSLEHEGSDPLLQHAKTLNIPGLSSSMSSSATRAGTSSAAGSPVRAAREMKEAAAAEGDVGGGANDRASSRQEGYSYKKKKRAISRYELLHKRVNMQQAALVAAQEELAEYKRNKEKLTRQLYNSRNVTGELLNCVEYYRAKSIKYHEVLYPPEVAPGKKQSSGAKRLDELKRELAKVAMMPRNMRQVTSSVMHGTAQTHRRAAFEDALRREIDKQAWSNGATEMQRIARGFMERRRLYQERLVRAAVLTQSRFRGYRTRKKLIWET